MRSTQSVIFTRLQDSIYFTAPDNSTLFVNLFVPSTLTWPQQGGVVTVTQNTSYPTDPDTTTIVSVSVTGACLSPAPLFLFPSTYRMHRPCCQIRPRDSCSVLGGPVEFNYRQWRALSKPCVVALLL